MLLQNTLVTILLQTLVIESSTFDGIFDDGAANVSGMTILEVSTYYSALTIRDFTDRAESSYTLAGPVLNLVPPSIQNPVAISSSSSLTGTINVQDTTYFPDAGYLFTNHGGIFQMIIVVN